MVDRSRKTNAYKLTYLHSFLVKIWNEFPRRATLYTLLLNSTVTGTNVVLTL